MISSPGRNMSWFLVFFGLPALTQHCVYAIVSESRCLGLGLWIIWVKLTHTHIHSSHTYVPHVNVAQYFQANFYFDPFMVLFFFLFVWLFIKNKMFYLTNLFMLGLMARPVPRKGPELEKGFWLCVSIFMAIGMRIKRWMSANSIGNEILIRPFGDFPF